MLLLLLLLLLLLMSMVFCCWCKCGCRSRCCSCVCVRPIFWGLQMKEANLDLSARKHCFVAVFVLWDRRNPDSFFQPFYRASHTLAHTPTEHACVPNGSALVLALPAHTARPTTMRSPSHP
jgi:hypothetical protein